MRKFSWGTNFASYTLVVIVTWIVLDALCYFFVPAGLVTGIPDYRPSPFDTIPRFYVQKNATRGFDLAENASGFFLVDGRHVFSIFTNSLGCFDNNEATAFKNEYLYFAGDS